MTKYPTDTSRDDRCRTIWRIWSTGETPINTPHAAAATASPVTIMTLSLDKAPWLGEPCSPAVLVRGASTAIDHATRRHRRREKARSGAGRTGAGGNLGGDRRCDGGSLER